MSPNTMASGWTVTGQEEQLGLDAYQRPVQGMLVRFLTKNGVSGSVFIPRAEYTVENVRAQVADAVAKIDAVHQLKG